MRVLGARGEGDEQPAARPHGARAVAVEELERAAREVGALVAEVDEGRVGVGGDVVPVDVGLPVRVARVELERVVRRPPREPRQQRARGDEAARAEVLRDHGRGAVAQRVDDRGRGPAEARRVRHDRRPAALVEERRHGRRRRRDERRGVLRRRDVGRERAAAAVAGQRPRAARRGVQFIDGRAARAALPELARRLLEAVGHEALDEGRAADGGG